MGYNLDLPQGWFLAIILLEPRKYKMRISEDEYLVIYQNAKGGKAVWGQLSQKDISWE